MTAAASRPTWPRRPAGIAYGGDYNPDQWPEAVWHEDVALMREAGVNLVTVGVFAWSRLEPAPGAWDPGWLVRALDLLHDGGIAVDLATATATPPPWFALAHPEALPVTASGTRLAIGTRQHVCPSSPAFRAAAAALVERLAREVGGHPAVVMWHVGNEYGDHVRSCWCDVSAADFRAWLRDRHGTLEALNEAWTTAVWSGRFSAWEEVMPPRAAPALPNPGQLLDWRRFSSDALLACHEAERAILARITPSLPVTTNVLMGSDALDLRRWAPHQDLLSADLYPDPLDPDSELLAAYTHHLMRSLGRGRPWLLMEQARGAVNWRPRNAPKRPGLMRALSLGAVGRGADGILFFQWRGARGGAEVFHSTLLPPGGTAARGWRQTVELGRDLRAIGELAGATTAAEVAVLQDWEAWWALGLAGHATDELRHEDQVLRWFRPFHESNVPVDVRGPAEELAGYRLVVAPSLFLVDPAAVASLGAWVEAGGTLVVGPRSGIVDPAFRVPPGHHPGLLRELLGLVSEEVWPLADAAVPVVFGPRVPPCGLDPGGLPGAPSVEPVGAPLATALVEADDVEPAGAEVVATYAGGPLAGRPAVTRHAVGRGAAWYVGTVLDEAGTARVVEAALREAGAGPVLAAPPGIRVARRDGTGAAYLVCVNHGADPARLVVPADATELLAGRALAAGEELELEPLGAAVLRLPPGQPIRR